MKTGDRYIKSNEQKVTSRCTSQQSAYDRQCGYKSNNWRILHLLLFTQAGEIAEYENNIRQLEDTIDNLEVRVELQEEEKAVSERAACMSAFTCQLVTNIYTANVSLSRVGADAAEKELTQNGQAAGQLRLHAHGRPGAHVSGTMCGRRSPCAT